jgi:hypothetical protein
MASRIFLSKVKVAVSLEKDRFRTNTQLDVYKYVFFYPSRFRSGRRNSHILCKFNESFGSINTHTRFCINLSLFPDLFPTFARRFCKASRSLTLCIHFRRKIFKIVLLLGYWSVREECLPLQPLKNALIFVKIEGFLKKIDCNALIIR